MNFKSVVALLSIFFLFSCNDQDKTASDLNDPLSEQEYVDQAFSCSMYFMFTGNKSAAQNSLTNAVYRISKNPSLTVQDAPEMKAAANKKVENVQTLFSKLKLTKKEASFYLLGENKCVSHAVFGALRTLATSEPTSNM